MISNPPPRAQVPPPAPLEFLTRAFEHITLPQTSFAGGKKITVLGLVFIGAKGKATLLPHGFTENPI